MTPIIEILPAATTKASCNGDAESPHPRVYLTTGAKNFVDCPYCGKRFMRKESAEL